MGITVNPHRAEVGLKDGLLMINGTWRAAADEATWTHRHPASGEVVGQFAVAGPADVDAAVVAARKAFDNGPWAKAGQRVKLLHRYADLLRDHADELRRLQALDNSVP